MNKKVKSILGDIWIEADEQAITRVHLMGKEEAKGEKVQKNPDMRRDGVDLSCMEEKLIFDAASQLEEYFQGKRKIFDVPLNPQGTDFQKKVWEELLKIPYGETRTYGEIAMAVGNPNACRAVGGANHRNPIWIMIPCHRVVGSAGQLTGYAGGIEVKKYLLELEKRG